MAREGKMDERKKEIKKGLRERERNKSKRERERKRKK